MLTTKHQSVYLLPQLFPRRNRPSKSEFWNFDLAILSAESANADGLWNSQKSIVQQQLSCPSFSPHAVLSRLFESRNDGTVFSQSLGRRRFSPSPMCPPKVLQAAEFSEHVNIVSCDLSLAIPDLEDPQKSAFPVHFL